MFQKFIVNLTQKLGNPLPGAAIQFEMAHVKREAIDLSLDAIKHYKQSAVLILLYPNTNNEPCILLIERSTYNGYHSGQIALPGGKQDETDSTLEATALREFFEETGSDTTPEIIGNLSSMTIPVSKFVVHPFVAKVNAIPQFVINEREVSKLIEWPVSELLNPHTVKHTTIEPIKGTHIQTPYFDVDGHFLWGATAMMLNELRYVLLK